MKVTQVRSFPVQDDEGHGYFIVRVDTDAGIHGLGEAGIRNWAGAIAQAVDHLAELIVGADPWQTERLWQMMFRGGFFPADKVYACAISAIDIALWDIKGKAAGLPLYRLLGGPVRDKVVCYPHSQGATTQALVDNARQQVDEGWRFVRWGQPETSGVFEAPGSAVLDPHKSVAIAVEQMRAVREAVGPEIELCFDVHTRLDPPHVIRLCKWLEEFHPFFIEDPIAVGEPGQLPQSGASRLTAHRGWRAVGFQVAVPGGDRRGADQLRAHRPVHRRRPHRGAQDHPLGGDALYRHRPAQPPRPGQRRGLRRAVHGVHQRRRPGDAATSGKHSPATLFPQQIGWQDGFAFAHDTPGLGVEMDLDVAAGSPLTPGNWPPRLSREDGAFTNW